jgi:hypothetical protein
VLIIDQGRVLLINMGHTIRKASDMCFETLIVMPRKESLIGTPFRKAVKTLSRDLLAMILEQTTCEDVYIEVISLKGQFTVYWDLKLTMT